MTTIEKQQIKDEALGQLRKYLRPGSEVTTTITHAARSGMSRSVVLQIVHRGRIISITSLMARALGMRVDARHGGIVVGGYGVDPGLHLVYRLGCAIWTKGTRRPHSMRNGQPDSSGGYALKQVWS